MRSVQVGNPNRIQEESLRRLNELTSRRHDRSAKQLAKETAERLQRLAGRPKDVIHPSMASLKEGEKTDA